MLFADNLLIQILLTIYNIQIHLIFHSNLYSQGVYSNEIFMGQASIDMNIFRYNC